MTDDDIRRFQGLFEALLASSDGNVRIETLFFEAVMLAGLGDLVYLEAVSRRMPARGAMAHSPAELHCFRQPAEANAAGDSGRGRNVMRSSGY
jgi:hypothetical protein